MLLLLVQFMHALNCVNFSPRQRSSHALKIWHYMLVYLFCFSLAALVVNMTDHFLESSLIRQGGRSYRQTDACGALCTDDFHALPDG